MDAVGWLVIGLAALDVVVVLFMIHVGQLAGVSREPEFRFRVAASVFLTLCAVAGASLGVNRIWPLFPNGVALALIVFIVIGVSVPVIAWPFLFERGYFR